MGIYSWYSGKLGLICFFIYFIILLRYKRVFYGIMPQSQNYSFILCVFVLYSVLGFLQYDTYHYAWAYKIMIEEKTRFGVEDFYFWLVQVLPQSYLLWRFVIWGTSSLLVIMTAKRLNLNSEVFGAMVPMFFLTQFTMTRASLGLSLMVFCAVVFVQSLEQKKILMIVLSVLGIWISYYLHKSMFIFIAFLVLAYLLPMNKPTIIISLILFPFLYIFVTGFSHQILSLIVLDDQQEMFINRYLGKEQAALNTIGLLSKIFEKTILVVFLFLIVKRMLYDRISSSKTHRFIFKYAYLMVYVSFLFLGQNTAIWISSRSLHAGMFALVLCASHCFNLQDTEKRTALERLSLFLMVIPAFWEQVSFIIKNW